eukprot:6324156-Prymnesium_polylepis.1
MAGPSEASAKERRDAAAAGSSHAGGAKGRSGKGEGAEGAIRAAAEVPKGPRSSRGRRCQGGEVPKGRQVESRSEGVPRVRALDAKELSEHLGAADEELPRELRRG